ncbi:hypothetical protein WMF31_11325 [Sorangium sp. So ce1036]|uniref:hypothetical protein n=1 Tax=Sorangium sp. So ce1036 TaxID=3133328 RepID=UPI003F02A3EF
MPIRPTEGNVVPPRHDPARRARVARRVATPAARAVTVLAALLGLSAPAAAQAPAAPAPAAPAPAAPAPDITAAPSAQPGGAVMPIPQGYYRPPPSLPPWANPWRIAYEPGDPIPRGYALKTRADRSLVGAGIATFSVPYAISFTVAGVATLVDDGDDGEEFAPLFIPFVGPMIALSTLEAEDSGVFWLTVNAVAQVGGLLLFAAGLANEDVYLERQVQVGHAPYAPPVLLGLPRTLPYKDDAPAPHGYRLGTQMNRRLARAGAIVLGSSWALAALTAGTVLSEGSSESESYAPLLVPVAGPFITLGTGEDIDFSDGDGRLSGALVLVDGLAQATGLALLVAGLVANQKIWVRDDIPQGASLPAPEILVGPTGGTLRFRF